MATPKKPIICDRCGSNNVTYHEATLSGFDLINLVSGENKFRYSCNSCHHSGATWA